MRLSIDAIATLRCLTNELSCHELCQLQERKEKKTAGTQTDVKQRNCGESTTKCGFTLSPFFC